ncbi:unnamed protein product [Eruca vesicaria subsp. sativa]|uniref:Oleosin n=1 Tax=Eruca vesicaria subsp. sativa TaxID=29727 RepID=A0ABC8LXH2_ERUVS|nr:unnamed protein product [Eruca vesicaria subsp. sativa]
MNVYRTVHVDFHKVHKIPFSSHQQTTTIQSQISAVYQKMFAIIQAVITAWAALTLLVLAGITLGGSAVALAVTTPLFIIFSPILVPAAIATTFLATGFTASGSIGAMAITVFMWLFKKITGKNPPKIPGITPKNPTTEGGKKEDKKKEKKKD